MLAIPNLCLAYTEKVSLLTRICNIVFPLGIYWMLMTLTKNPGKTILILSIFIFFGAFQIVLLYLFREAVIAVDMFLNLATTNSSEVSELLSNLLPAVAFVIFIYGGSIVLAIISIKKHTFLDNGFLHKERVKGAILACVGFIFITFNYMVNPQFKFHDDIYPANVFYNLYLAIDRDIKVKGYHKNVVDFKFNTVLSDNSNEPKIVVLIIGETSRAANFGLYGYERQTTPNLCHLRNKGNLIAFDNVLTQSNTTHKSVPLIMSDIDAAHYDDIYHRKGIITAFKEAGYKTVFLSNQRRNHSFIDFFGQEADEVEFLTDTIKHDKELKDCVLLKSFCKELNDSSNNKKFIVLHTYGSHFAYHERYPKEFSVYVPDVAPEAEYKYRENLVNSYDNTIRYADNIINQVISDLEKSGTQAALIYTSDHGEDIFDDSRKLFLHASPTPSFYQLWVPYIVWVSDEYKHVNPDVVKNMNKNIHKPVSSNEVTFHTLLSLGGINGEVLDKTKSVTSASYSCKKRYYLNDHNYPVEISELKLDSLDYKLMKRHGISI